MGKHWQRKEMALTSERKVPFISTFESGFDFANF